MTSEEGTSTPDTTENAEHPRGSVATAPAPSEPLASVVPSDEDPFVASSTTVIGGPTGRFARVEGTTPDGRARLVNLPWQLVGVWLTLASCVTVLVGFLQKSHCYLNGWGVPDVYWRACYSDVPYFFTSGLLADKHFPYAAGAAETSLEQPLGTGTMLWAVAQFVPGNEELEAQQMYMGIWVVLTVLLAIATTVLTVATLRRRPWAASHVALSPVVVTAALVAPELIGVALVSLALWMWRKQWLIAAGIVMGLAILTRTYPILIVIVLGLIALRAGVLKQWLITAGVSLVTFGGILTVTGLFTDFTVMKPYQTWQSTESSFGSIWYVLSTWDVYPSAALLTTLVSISWSAAILAGAALALMAKRRPRVGEVGIVVVGIVIIFSKTLPVQTSLWLVPLIALAGLRWRDHLIWASTEVAYFGAMWVYLGGTTDAEKAMPLPWYFAFTMLRILGIIWLIVQAWRQAWNRPALDDMASDEEALETEPDDVAGPAYGRHDALVVATAP